MKAIVNSVKGTRDFYPEEMARRSWLYQQIRTVSEQFGYLEYDGPFLEKIDLYAAKSGEELVKKQAFVFPDRGGELIALRPELTPSLARMVAQKQNELVYPLRWWSFGPFWRYEQPGKGRSREFFQWNIDLIGTNSPEADAELLAVGAELLRAVGLRPDQVKIYVNNRRLINHKLAEVGITGDLAQTALGVIDRQGKMKAAEWDNYVLEQGLSAENLAALKEILANRELWRESDELRRLFGALDALGVSEYVEFDPHIIRGLLYYTGTVFEAFDVNHEFRAVFGGGRYDNLVGAVGGDPLPGVGFAMGDMIILLLLEKFGCLPAGPAEPAPVLVTIFDEARLPGSFGLAASLRRQGLRAVCYPEAVKLPRQLKYADKLGFRVVVIVGPDEEAQGLVTIKDLPRRTQVTVAKDHAGQVIREMLATNPGS